MDKKYQKLEWTDQMISDFWDFKAEFYQGQYFANMVGEYIIKDLEKYFPNAKNVLDWGSGPGFLIKHLLARKLDVYALDFSPSSISMVNEKYGQDAKFKGAFLPEDLKKQNLKKYL